MQSIQRIVVTHNKSWFICIVCMLMLIIWWLKGLFLEDQQLYAWYNMYIRSTTLINLVWRGVLISRLCKIYIAITSNTLTWINWRIKWIGIWWRMMIVWWSKSIHTDTIDQFSCSEHDDDNEGNVCNYLFVVNYCRCLWWSLGCDIRNCYQYYYHIFVCIMHELIE